ncbi:MAG: ABC transporter ATP-binding protein [Polyangiaceae bacterium]|nr:ABC transporter ATP-binding protein [Polyangiaceae bacterium]
MSALSSAVGHGFEPAPPPPGEALRPAPGRTVLRATDLIKTYGSGENALTVLRGVSMILPTGGLSLVMGPSGSGKTTLISVLTGLLHPSSGQVELCGELISSMNQKQVAAMRARHVGFVFQSYNLFPALSATDNVALALTMRGSQLEAARVKAREALGRVGLAARASHLPADLSGGEKQRVAIARALVSSPTLLVGDEVTAALDTNTAFRVMDILRAYVTSHTAVLLVTHDRRLEAFADRVFEVADGQIQQDRLLSPGVTP